MLMPVSDAYNSFYQMIVLVVFGFVIALFIFIVALILLFDKKVVNPIEHLMRTLREIQKNNWMRANENPSSIAAAIRSMRT